ncbi:MAG: S-formylglutathione hydrolase [Rhodomicrobium sp.]|nr:MAG: S-formylglutathione hydrolase [Rhodomicrobium sp.]
MSLNEIGNNKSFGGQQKRFEHQSESCNCKMTFSIYLPKEAEQTAVPLLYWLSGLTCTDENFVTKAGAQQYASEHGIAIVAPDTSPRGEGVADDPEGAYDFGLGAGFYVNATEAPFASHYKMYDYITKELPALINANFNVDPSRTGIFGHSMGGHGALTIALNNPGVYKSVSAFAPISSPMNCPWGEKALSGYLGSDRETWKKHDAAHMITVATEQLPMLIDQGTGDNFLEEQLKPELLEAAAKSANYPITLRMQPGYDHSYFFMASFMGDHIAHHVKALKS